MKELKKLKTEDDLAGCYMSPDLHDMYRIKFMHKAAQSSSYALWISAGSLLVATISLIVAIIK